MRRRNLYREFQSESSELILPSPSPQSIRNRIQQTYERGYVLGEDDVRYSIAPMSVASWRGEFVRGLCLAEKATSSVEVGMAWGLSTLHIIEAGVPGAAKRF